MIVSYFLTIKEEIGLIDVIKKIPSKIDKILGIIIASLFVLMIITNIYLNYKVIKLENNIEKLNLSIFDTMVN